MGIVLTDICHFLYHLHYLAYMHDHEKLASIFILNELYLFFFQAVYLSWIGIGFLQFSFPFGHISPIFL